MYILLTLPSDFINGGLGLGLGIMVSITDNQIQRSDFSCRIRCSFYVCNTCYLSAVSSAPKKYKWIILVNPMTSIVDTFRFAFLGAGSFNSGNLLYTSIFVVVILFNRNSCF